MARFLILNGPNINMLGRRDPTIYGSKTLEEVNREISRVAGGLGVEVEFFQSNVEGLLVDCIQENWDKVQGIVINPGALTHYGLTLKDALIDFKRPFIESTPRKSLRQGALAQALRALRRRPRPNCGVRMEKLYCGVGDIGRTG